MNYFKTILFIICFLTALFISFIHTLIHLELSLSIFYLFPIPIAAWFIGGWAALLNSDTSEKPVREGQNAAGMGKYAAGLIKIQQEAYICSREG